MPKKYCFKFGFATNKSCTYRYMPSKQETEDQMVLDSSITSQDKPKVGVLCTVLDSNVMSAVDNTAETVHKTPTLG